jgi:N-acetylglucosaminyldiphosphoundecaprenol N-acetyl-beta-D-mannosaminyltransferase
MTSGKYVQVLGIRFFSGDVDDAVALAKKGGLIVFPSAPVLVELPHNAEHRRALLNADLAFTDSGLMVLLWRYLKRERILRISGLAYMKRLITLQELRTAGVFWVLPTARSKELCCRWLAQQGINYSDDDFYIAPIYPAGAIVDAGLAAELSKRSAKQIIIGLGGGTQERLGLYLKQTLTYKPAIHCIGAALAFLTGDQAPIPSWADKMFLGWLVRCVTDPLRFVPRYWKARHLIRLIRTYGHELPVVK